MKSSWMLPTCCWIMSLLVSSTSSFLSPVSPTGLKRLFAISQNNNVNENSGNNMVHLLDADTVATSTTMSSRRDWFQKSMAVVIATSAAIFSSTSTTAMADDSAASSSKILLLGGTGLVGSQIRKILNEKGISVIATSRNGRDDTVAFDVTTTTNVATQVQALAKGCTGVISTVGVLGTPDDTVVNAANALAAAGAKAAGVSHFVYITVSPEVKDMAQNIDFLQAYMKGKTFARDAVINYFGGNNNNDKLSFTLIEPTFIYGGDKFQVNPPRVTGLYGSLIEGVLSSAPLRLAANLMPGGLLKVALEPPVSAETVAKAAIAGALGKTTTTTKGAYLDTYDRIHAAADLV